MVNLEIIGTGSYLPDEVIENSSFEGKSLNVYGENGDIEDVRQVTHDSIVRVTGINERRKSHEPPSEMGLKAARNAIEMSGINVDSLVGIIFATVSEKQNFLNAAQKVQLGLGARNCRVAYDPPFACAGFVEALAQARARVLIEPGNYLVIASEWMTSMVDPTDLNSTLFGDGAGAVVLRPTEDEVGVLATYTRSDPFDGADKWIFRDENGFCRMPHGGEVMRDAVRKMMEAASDVKEQLGWDRADIYIPHQANGRIIDGVKKRVENEGSIVYRNIDRYGNMSSSTCAVALDQAWREGIVKPGSRIVVPVYGAGRSIAAAGIKVRDAA